MHRSTVHYRRIVRFAVVMLAACLSRCSSPRTQDTAGGPAPVSIFSTGLFAKHDVAQLAPGVLAFTPQYPLWTDGATKRRWIKIPPGTQIDTTNPDQWKFPVGTLVWKEFSHGNVLVETRMMEKLKECNGSSPKNCWSFRVFVWQEDQADANEVLGDAKETGFDSHVPTHANSAVMHRVPGTAECLSCHSKGGDPVLGFEVLQLSDDIDPGLSELDREHLSAHPRLSKFVEMGVVASVTTTASISTAGGPTERTALGYIHGNCAHCHNAQGTAAFVGMDFRFSAGTGSVNALLTTVLVNAKYTPSAAARILPGNTEMSAVFQRFSSTDPAFRMPKLGGQTIDQENLELIRTWIFQMQ